MMIIFFETLKTCYFSCYVNKSWWICSDDQISCEVLGMILFFSLLDFLPCRGAPSLRRWLFSLLVTPTVVLKVAFAAIAANLFFDLIASNFLFVLF